MLLARDLLTDLKGILARAGMALGQLEDVRDRVHRFDRDMAAAAEGPEALIVHHFRTCPQCTAGPGCDLARVIAEYLVPLRAA